LAAYSLPYKLGLILAALVGIAVGTILERTGERQLREASPTRSAGEEVTVTSRGEE
jgi:hypothetical protein